MPRKPLEPGQPGKLSPLEPRLNEKRKVYEQSRLIGEPIGPPTRIWASGKTKEQCRRAMEKRTAEWKPKAAPLGSYSSDPTVLELVRAWLLKYENSPRKRPQNARSYWREIEPGKAANAKKDKIVISGSDLGNMKAKVVRPLHIRLHLEQIDQWGSKQSLHKTILRQAFALFVLDGGRDDNPVNNVAGYRGENAPKQHRKAGPVNPYFPDLPQPFSPDEMDLYLKLERFHFATHPMTDKRYIDYRLLAYEIAGRPSEPVALRWDEDIDFENGSITVAGTIIDTELRIRQIRRVIEDYQLRPDEIVVRDGWEELPEDTMICVTYRQPFPKTAESMRTIKASDETMSMLRRLKLRAAPGQRLVMPSRKGTVLPSDQMTRVWREIVRDTPLQGWTSPKTLRSTRATRVAEKYGVPAARAILGHEKDSPVTTQHYVVEEREVVNFADAR